MNIKETIDFRLKSTSLALMRMYNLIASKNGITQSIGYVLVNIGKNGTPATKIAPLMGMGITSLSRLLKKMETDGYIFRTKDTKDKRVVIISLTEKGLMLRKEVKKTVINFNNKILSIIPTTDMKTFISVFDVIKNQVEADIKSYNTQNILQ